jgi:hypothetical protein
MAIKTVKDLKKDSKKKESKKQAVKDTPKKAESKKRDDYLFVPFAAPGVKTEAVIEIRYMSGKKFESKKVTIKIDDQKYVINKADFPKGYEDKFIAQLFKQGMISAPAKDPSEPDSWKIRHGDYADGQQNNFTGKSFIDLGDGGKIELNWVHGLVETKDKKIRDILVSKGHYDMTTGHVFIQKIDPTTQVVTGVGKGAYTVAPTENEIKKNSYYEAVKGTLTK